MSIIKVVPCPACGKTKLLRHRCACKGLGQKPREPSTAERVIIGGMWILGFTVLLLVIGGTVAAVASYAWATGVLGALLIITRLMQRGYDFEDQIDVQFTMLPAPIKWLVRLEMFFNFWQQDRPLWRCYCLANLLAIVSWILFGKFLGF